MSRVAIVERPLDASAIQAEVGAPDVGAVSLFVGTVRDSNGGRPVVGIEYSAYVTMAARELEKIAGEAERRWTGARVAIEHRLGTLAIGDASVVVAASHAHRAEAMDACRFVIEALKQRVPIWKREHYADGTREWVAAAAHAAAGRSAVAPVPAAPESVADSTPVPAGSPR